MKWLRLTTLCLFLGGCTVLNLQELRSVRMPEDAYSAQLSQLYLAFAEAEAKNYDWWAQSYFAGKGLRAAYGHSVEPEKPARWKVPAEVLPSMNEARVRLMEALQQHKAQQPVEAAKALFYYDCWVEQQSENWQPEDIRYCREKFDTHLNVMVNQVAATPPAVAPVTVPPAIIPPVAPTQAPVPAPAPIAPAPVQPSPLQPAKPAPVTPDVHIVPPPAPPPPLEYKSPLTPSTSPLRQKNPLSAASRTQAAPAAVPRTAESRTSMVLPDAYLIYFPQDMQTLTTSARTVLARLATDSRAHPAKTVMINSHTDRQGEADVNMKRSLEAANALKLALVKQGVSPSHISVFAFGESDPKVPTADGIQEPANRRAEIFLE